MLYLVSGIHYDQAGLKQKGIDVKIAEAMNGVTKARKLNSDNIRS